MGDGAAPPWAGGAPHWHVLATAFGAGVDFLATWQAWRRDPRRPQRLFFTAVVPEPPSTDTLRAQAATCALAPDLVEALAPHCQGLLPGVHRLVFDGGGVQLTLLVGPGPDVLQPLDAVVDSVILTGIDAHTHPPESAWVKAIARLSHIGTCLAGPLASEALCQALASTGFQIDDAARAQGRLHARFAPPWPHRSTLRQPAPGPLRAVVVGAGLAGAATACSLARRGWQVTVLDSAEAPAAGASGLPAGLIAPHVSPDDAVLSRLSRAGVQATLLRAGELLVRGVDWNDGGVLEHRVEGKRNLPSTPEWAGAGRSWSDTAPPAALDAAHLPPDTPALWHARGGWLRPAALVEQQLRTPGIQWQGGTEIHTLRHEDGLWHLFDGHGRELARAEHVVLAAAYATRNLLDTVGQGAWPLNPLRGQISWGWVDELPDGARRRLPPFPVNGHGSFVHGLPVQGHGERMAWFVGSTFERGVASGHVQAQDHLANQARLTRLLPELAAAMPEAFNTAQGWAGVRCTLPDRLPAVGPIDPDTLPGLPGLHVCTGMGARGLTLSVLCGEVLAANLHGEPWPLERPLAQALMARRFHQRHLIPKNT